MFEPPRDSTSPGHRSAEIATPKPRAMLPMRVLSIVGIASSFALFGWQVSRIINDQSRLATLTAGSLIAGLIGAVGIVLWTYIVVENARRVIDPATTQQLPKPGYAASTWILPMVFVAASASSVAYLSTRLNSPIEGTESSFPLVLAVIALIVVLPLTYPPVNYLTGVVRKIGGHGVKLGQWLLVPVTLGAVGASMIFGLRAGGAFGDTDDGLAPTWVVAVTAVVPAIVVVLLGWRAASTVEADVVRAFDRRSGSTSRTVRQRSSFSLLPRDEGPNRAALRERGRIRQIPGTGLAATIITAGLAGLALMSVVGGIVMYLFWQEGRDGVLLASQTERAWDVVATLQSAQRVVAYALVVTATVWAALVVTNVRLATARRRNPVLAALAWPIAGAGVWIVGDRWVVDGTATDVVMGFLAQSALLYVPFFLLERSADAVGTRRNPVRFAYAFGIVLLVYIQGLGGLSTLSETALPGEFGRLAGYLAVGALVQLLAMFAVTEATRSLVDATRNVADTHNALVAQRAAVGARPESSYRTVGSGD